MTDPNDKPVPDASADDETVRLTKADLAGARADDDPGAGEPAADDDQGAGEPSGAEALEAEEPSVGGEPAEPEDPLAAEAEAAGVDPEDELPVDPRADKPSVDEADSSTVEPREASARPRGIMGWFRPRVTGAGALIAVLVGLLGFALIAQVQSNSSATTLSSDRPEDLVRILSDLDARKDRLNADITNLQNTKRQLESGAQGREAALAEAARRADELGILSGSLAAQGPGLRVHLASGTESIGAADVLDIVEELRGAGAEAMQIAGSDGTTVRIVASTYFVDSKDGVIADGRTLPGTLTLTAIGEPQTMQTALSIPGGALDTTRTHGGNVQVESPGTVQVTALHPTTDLKYAKPAP
jgi:uncharacterized protein YlxW (UPF0749 family)